MYKTIPLALVLAAMPAIVRAQSADPIVEISVNHGHTFTLEGTQARIVKAWPGVYESFDFGEHPKIPNAKFIFVKLKPGAKLDSTTLTLIVDDGSGKETTKSYVLKRVSGIPTQTTTLIGNQPVFAAKPEPVQSVATSQISSPPPGPVQQIHKEKKGQKPKKLKVAQEFSRAFSPGVGSAEVEDKPMAKEAEQAESEDKEDPDVPVKAEPKSTDKTDSERLPLIRAPKTPQSKATVERIDKDLIERSKLNNYQIAHYLMNGLYRAQNLKQINRSKDVYWQTQSMARVLRRGNSVEKALRISGLSPVTFDNLLGHGGVGK